MASMSSPDDQLCLSGFLNTSIVSTITTDDMPILSFTESHVTVPPMNPFRVAEMAIELQIERMRVIEALNARDTLVQCLANAYASMRQTTTVSDAKEVQLAPATPTSAVANAETEAPRPNEEVSSLRAVIKQLQEELDNAKETQKTSDLPPRYEEQPVPIQLTRAETSTLPLRAPLPLCRSASQGSATAKHNVPNNLQLTADQLQGLDQIVAPLPQTDDPEIRNKARNAILAALPLPVNGPHDDLEPILIPPPYTLHEFLSSASGFLRTSLSNYRVLQQITTSWCPGREEHGYFLTPVFKCSTNPRVVTAHRWAVADILSRLNIPTDCFYNKDGLWYYAGMYRAFRMEDLTVKEWEALSNETTSAIVKETITGRKNTSPQNVYEITQLYACGALKVACVGLQCIGFNKPVFHALLDLSSKWAHSIPGKWKPGAPTASISPTCTSPSNMSVPGTNANTNGNTPLWNQHAACVLDVADKLAGLSLNIGQN